MVILNTNNPRDDDEYIVVDRGTVRAAHQLILFVGIVIGSVTTALICSII